MGGSGGGTSGRAIAFCLGRTGLNPETFSGQNRHQSILAGYQAFSNNVIEWGLHHFIGGNTCDGTSLFKFEKQKFL